MNRDEVIRMAREAGIRAEPGNSFADDMYLAVLYRFATLVAAAEREACLREAEYYAEYSATARSIAAGIRARSNI